MHQIGRYQVLSEIGRGARGVVFLALDPNLDRQVALKTFSFSEYDDPQNWQVFSERLLKEAKRTGALTHPNIVGVYDAFEENQAAYVVMEYVDGQTLDALLEEQGRLDPLAAVAIVREVAAGLDYAHGQGIVHRDIKPSNLIVNAAGHAKIADFGLAKRLGSNTTTTMTVLDGTPVFMSPEQLEETGNIDGRADQFALGCIAYLLLTGRKPFEADTIGALAHQVVNQDAPAPSQINPALSRGVDLVFRRVLAKNPMQRFNSCSEFVDVLEGALRGDRTVVEAPGGGGAVIPAKYLLAVVLAIVLLTLGALFMRKSDKKPAEVATAVPAQTAQQTTAAANSTPLLQPSRPVVESGVTSSGSVLQPSRPEPQSLIQGQSEIAKPVVQQPAVQPAAETESVPAASGSSIPLPSMSGSTATGPIGLKIYLRRDVMDKNDNFTKQYREVNPSEGVGELDRPLRGELFVRVNGSLGGRRSVIRWYKDGQLYDEVPLGGGELGKLVPYGNRGDAGQYEVQVVVDGLVRKSLNFQIH